MVKAALLIRYNPKAAARYMLTAQGKPFGEGDVERNAAELTAWEEDLPAANPHSRQIGAISQNGVQKYIQLLADSGMTKRALPASEIVTDQFIEFANDFDRSAFEKRAKSIR